MRGFTLAFVSYVLVVIAKSVNAKKDNEVLKIKGMHIVLAWVLLAVAVVFAILGI